MIQDNPLLHSRKPYSINGFPGIRKTETECAAQSVREQSPEPDAREQMPICAQDVKTGHSLTVGPRGPVLETDSVLHETLETMVHSKRLERVVHTKGYGAFGRFQTTQSMTPYTTASFLQSPGTTTEVFARFSLAVSVRGTPDTPRNVRGFSVKFYAEDGVFDLLCNHIPVFFIRDAMKFPGAIAALSPSPESNLPDPNAFWSYVAANPETVNMLTYLYSDLGCVNSFRHMAGHSVSTFVWKNRAGARKFVRYHWLPEAGVRTISAEQAMREAGESPDIAGQDLHDAIAAGKAAVYSLAVQLMDPKDAEKLAYDPLDGTKVWSETAYPPVKVGKLTLDRNPSDFASEVEASAFSPNNLIPGIELSDDKLLAGRANIYWDAQRYRLGPDFRSIPVNGQKKFRIPEDVVTSGEGMPTEGVRQRSEIPKPDNFAQAGEHYRSMRPEARETLENNVAEELKRQGKAVQECVLTYFEIADANFAEGVSRAMKRP